MNTYTYKYPRPAITTDIVVCNYKDDEIYLLLIERKNEPFKGMWAIPGGFLDYNERGKEGAVRELQEETGLQTHTIFLSHIADNPNRDPRGRIVSLCYVTCLNSYNNTLQANDDARDVRWFSLSQVPKLACDHAEIVMNALKKLHEMLLIAREPYIIETFTIHERECLMQNIEQYLDSQKLC